MFSCFLRSRRTSNKDKAPARNGDATTDGERCVDPPQFTLHLLTAATGNFAAKNRLGVQQEREGDLGPVFKGKLDDGQVVAVRRLPATYSYRQFHELRDQLLLATKLRHDNIVQLLGVCLERREKLLVYEYLPNASLDTILFDTERRRRHLDWEKRYSIIRGIARGLTYLHNGSCQGINLKGILRPSKVLLDDDMNPKILDARIIPPPNTEDLDHTFVHDRPCTTIYRYAAPEWTMIGRTSTKSDMFSFGVILLEVVTGRGMYYDWRNGEKSNSGLTYVWDKWKSGSVVDIADALLGHRYPLNEMCNCVHIGLLCLQEDQKLRPDASMVMQALDTSCPTSLPSPSIPYGYRVRSIA